MKCGRIEDNLFVYTIEPPVDTGESEVKSFGELAELANPDLGDLQTSGPSIDLDLEDRFVTACYDPHDVAERMTTLLGGRHIVTYDISASNANIISDPSSW